MPILMVDGSIVNFAELELESQFAKDNGGKYITSEEALSIVSMEKEMALTIEDENIWREGQMSRVANQILMLDDDDPKAETGTARQWRDYRIQLRSWTDTNPDFPDSSKRPIAPT
jgi:hypothetical protein